MMVKRLFGDSITQIADEFGVSRRNVQRRLAAARLDGVPDEARDIFIQDMLPASMAVMKQALDGDDLKLAVQVAFKIVDGLKAMDTAAAAAGPAAVEETLESWRVSHIIRTPAAAIAVNLPTVSIIDVSPAAPAEPLPASLPPAAPVHLQPPDSDPPAPAHDPAPDGTSSGWDSVQGG